MSNKLAEQLLVEAVLQIRYLGEKFGETGSGNAIAARIETYLASTTNSSNTACDAVGQEKFGKAKYQFLVGRDKPFFIDTFRSLLNQYDKEEISLSKVVEELNVQAYKWHLGRHGLTPDDADKIYGITDADIDEKVKKLNSMQASKAEPKPSLSETWWNKVWDACMSAGMKDHEGSGLEQVIAFLESQKTETQHSPQSPIKKEDSV